LLLPKLSDAQIAWVIQQVATYIEQQHQTFVGRAVHLDSVQKGTMQPFFPGSTLDSARVVVLSGERVGNPTFYGDVIWMRFVGNSLPDFGHMAAITFLDTIVSHESFTNELLFHELVHVVQDEKLGLADFAAKYVTGFLTGGSYEAIPLEINAYQLTHQFAAAPMNPFSVEEEVQAWIDAGRF
jgi:hypothetical protein